MWSNGDIQLLRENYSKQEVAQTAKMLGKSYNSIRMKAWRLGLISAYHFCTLPLEITSDVAYILGVLCGDGCLSIRQDKWASKSFKLGAKDKDFVIAFSEAVFRAFGRLPKVNGRWKKDPKGKMIFLYEASSEHKKISEYLLSYGSFGSRNWKIPKAIFDGNTKVKAMYLRGFYDSEGSIHFKKSKGLHFPLLEASTINPSTLDIPALLSALSIRSSCWISERPNSKYYTVGISDLRSLRIFAEKIGFNIHRKQLKLLKYLRVPKTGIYAKKEEVQT